MRTLTRAIKSQHAYCLNALDEMQQSFLYATRRDVLKEAEGLIVRYEAEVAALRQEIERLTAERDAAQFTSKRGFEELQKQVEKANALQATLTRVEGELNEVKAERDRWWNKAVERTISMDKQAKDLAQAEQDNSRLREALQEMVDMESAQRCGASEDYLLHEWPKRYAEACTKAQQAINPTESHDAKSLEK